MKLESVVHIVEDDDAHQSAMCLILESVGLTTKVYGSAQQFLDEFTRGDADCPECLLTDVRLPGMTGLDLQKILLERKISLPTVVISGHADVPIAVEALKSGAVDFIEKPFRQQKLLDAVQLALARSEEARNQENCNSQLQTRWSNLTGRQREVMEMMVAGKPNKIIADTMGLSIKTIEQHRSLVMKNMEASSFADLVQMALSLKANKG